MFATLTSDGKKKSEDGKRNSHRDGTNPSGLREGKTEWTVSSGRTRTKPTHRRAELTGRQVAFAVPQAAKNDRMSGRRPRLPHSLWISGFMREVERLIRRPTLDGWLAAGGPAAANSLPVIIKQGLRRTMRTLKK
jgi:hypothetical protein